MTSSSESSPQKYDFNIFNCKTPPLDTPRRYLSTNRISRLSRHVKYIFPQYLELCRLLEQHKNNTRPETVTECGSKFFFRTNGTTRSSTKLSDNIIVEKNSVPENCSEQNIRNDETIGSNIEVGNDFVAEKSSITENCSEQNVCNDGTAESNIVVEKNNLTESCFDEYVRNNGTMRSNIEVGNDILSKKHSITENCSEENNRIKGAIESSSEMGSDILTENNSAAICRSVENDGVVERAGEVANGIVIEQNNVTVCRSEENRSIDEFTEDPTETAVAKNSVTECRGEDNNRVSETIASITKENIDVDRITGSPFENPQDIVIEKNNVTVYTTDKNNRNAQDSSEMLIRENDRVNESEENPSEMVLEECRSQKSNGVDVTVQSPKIVVTENEAPGTGADVEPKKSENVSNNIEMKKPNELRAREKNIFSPGRKLNEIIASKNSALARARGESEPKLAEVMFPLENALKLANYVIQNLTGKHRVFVDLDESDLLFFFSDTGLRHFTTQNAYVNALIEKTHLWVQSLKRHSPDVDITEDDIFRVLRSLYYSRVRADDPVKADERQYFIESSTYQRRFISDKFEIQIKHVFTENPLAICVKNSPMETTKRDNRFVPPIPCLKRDSLTRPPSARGNGTVREKSTSPLVKQKSPSPSAREISASSLDREEDLRTRTAISSSDRENRRSVITSVSPTVPHCSEASMPSLEVDSSVAPAVRVQCGLNSSVPPFALEKCTASVSPSTRELPTPVLDLQNFNSSMFCSTGGDDASSASSSMRPSLAEAQRENNNKKNTPSSMVNDNRQCDQNFPRQQTTPVVLSMISNPKQHLLQNEHNFTKYCATQQGNSATPYQTFAYSYNNSVASAYPISTARNDASGLRNDVPTGSTQQAVWTRESGARPGGSVAPPGRHRSVTPVKCKPAQREAETAESLQQTPRKPPERLRKRKASPLNLHTEARATPSTSGVSGSSRPSQTTCTTRSRNASVQNRGPQSNPAYSRNEMNDRSAHGGSALSPLPGSAAPRQAPQRRPSSARIEPDSPRARACAANVTRPTRYQLNGGSTPYCANTPLPVPVPERTASRQIPHNRERQQQSAAGSGFNPPQPYAHAHAHDGSKMYHSDYHSGPTVPGTAGNVFPIGQFYHYGNAPHHGNNFRHPFAAHPPYEHFGNRDATPMYPQNSYYAHGTTRTQHPDLYWQWNAAASRMSAPSGREAPVDSNRGTAWSVPPPPPPPEGLPNNQIHQQQQQQGHPERHPPAGPSSAWERRSAADRSRSRSRSGTRSKSKGKSNSYLRFYRKPSHLTNIHNIPHRSPPKLRSRTATIVRRKRKWCELENSE